MPSFFLAMVAVFAASLGARDQLLIARQSATLGRANGLLVVGVLCAIISGFALAWAGDAVAAMLPASGKRMLVAFALVFAAIELFWPVRLKRAAEPTHSLGALGIVLLARQMTDAARFCVFALAAATGSAILAGLGGALGGAAAIGAAWMMGAQLERAAVLRAIRLALASILAIAAITAALSARGII